MNYPMSKCEMKNKKKKKDKKRKEMPYESLVQLLRTNDVG